MTAMRTGSHQCPQIPKRTLPDLPWCDSQNPPKDKTSPSVPNSPGDLVAHSLSELGTPVGRWKGGPAWRSIFTTVPWPPEAALDKGVVPQPGVQ